MFKYVEFIIVLEKKSLTVAILYIFIALHSIEYANLIGHHQKILSFDQLSDKFSL